MIKERSKLIQHNMAVDSERGYGSVKLTCEVESIKSVDKIVEIFEDARERIEELLAEE